MFPCLFQLLKPTYIPLLMAPSLNLSKLLFPSHLLLTLTFLLSSYKDPCSYQGHLVNQIISLSQGP